MNGFISYLALKECLLLLLLCIVIVYCCGHDLQDASRSDNGSFHIITENIRCGTTGTTCSKAIKIFVGVSGHPLYIFKAAERSFWSTY